MFSLKMFRLVTAVFLLVVLLQACCWAQQQRCYRKVRPRREPARCDRSARYRTVSGRCNNLRHPEWGSAGETLRRLLPNAYDDGRDAPRGGRHPSRLPNPRWISQKNHPDTDVPDPRFTHMVMQFGQFLDHDISLTPKDEESNCCESGVQGPSCFTIPIPSPDRFYSWVNNTAKCLNFVRSTHVCNLSTREQFNELTAFIDAGQVYGSEQEHSAVLRTYSDGKLHVHGNHDQLPTRQQLNLRPNTRRLRPEKPEDFMAGDMRVNEHPFLAALHVVFVREHNRIAKLLREYLPRQYRTDEILYQESRRLVAAQMQNIVYGEYLPTVLGVDVMRRYGLIVEEESSYDPAMDPTIVNAFATAAFRFGHSMVNGMFKLVSQRKGSSRSGGGNKDVYWLWRLREVFDGQSIRGARLPLENMIEGLVTQEPQTCDSFFSTEITDHLFQKNSRRENFGEDLLSLNVQRGRDHGLPSYGEYREVCGLSPLSSSWGRKPSDLNAEYWKKLNDVFDSPLDIDLYLGAIAEETVPGGVVGPTFACIIAEQFRRIKLGDRFFYTHTDTGRGLGPVARGAVLRRTLGDVICGVSQLPALQKWITLQTNDDYNQMESCAAKETLDMRAIAAEIARELSAGAPPAAVSARTTTAATLRPSTTVVRTRTSGSRRLVNGGPRTRNNLLRTPGQPGSPPRPSSTSATFRFGEGDAVSRPLPQEKQRTASGRVRSDFSFPREVRRRPAASAVNQRRSLPTAAASPSQRFLSSTSARVKPTTSSLGRSSPSSGPRFGVSTHACLFKLCPIDNNAAVTASRFRFS